MVHGHGRRAARTRRPRALPALPRRIGFRGRCAIEEFDASAREAAEQLAADGVRIATEAGFEAKPVTIEARHGVWRPIVEFAEKRDAHAVVVGSHGLSPVTSALLGSVSHGIVNHCTRPMVVVPSKGK